MYLSTFFTILFTIFLAPSFGISAPSYTEPLVNGRIQADANCIQCAGRFLCGHTDQVVKLQYFRNYISQSVKEHCAKMSHEVSESLRISKGEARTEEAVRYKDYHSKFVKNIQKNKGGNLKFKEERGFPFSDFILYTRKTKKVSKTLRKNNIKKAKRVVKKMRNENVILPVVSIEDFRDFMAASGKDKRLVNEYQHYIKDLLALHPSELEESAPGTGVYLKALVPNTKLKSKFAKTFGARASGKAIGSSGGGSSAGGAGANIASTADKANKSRMPSSPESSVVELDQNGNIVNSVNQKKAKRQKDQKISAELLRTSRNEAKSKRERKQWIAGSAPTGANPGKSYYRDTTSGFSSMRSILGKDASSICGQGSTRATQNFARDASISIAKDYGQADTSIGRTQISNDLQATINKALRAGNSDDCVDIVKDNISNTDNSRLVASAKTDIKTAEEELKKEREFIAKASTGSRTFDYKTTEITSSDSSNKAPPNQDSKVTKMSAQSNSNLENVILDVAAIKIEEKVTEDVGPGFVVKGSGTIASDKEKEKEDHEKKKDTLELVNIAPGEFYGRKGNDCSDPYKEMKLFSQNQIQCNSNQVAMYNRCLESSSKIIDGFMKNIFFEGNKKFKSLPSYSRAKTFLGSELSDSRMDINYAHKKFPKLMKLASDYSSFEKNDTISDWDLLELAENSINLRPKENYKSALTRALSSKEYCMEVHSRVKIISTQFPDKNTSYLPNFYNKKERASPSKFNQLSPLLNSLFGYENIPALKHFFNPGKAPSPKECLIFSKAVNPVSNDFINEIHELKRTLITKLADQEYGDISKSIKSKYLKNDGELNKLRQLVLSQKQKRSFGKTLYSKSGKNLSLRSITGLGYTLSDLTTQKCLETLKSKSKKGTGLR